MHCFHLINEKTKEYSIQNLMEKITKSLKKVKGTLFIINISSHFWVVFWLSYHLGCCLLKKINLENIKIVFLIQL